MPARGLAPLLAVTGSSQNLPEIIGRQSSRRAADRVRALPMAVRFDPGWSYDRPDPHNETHAVWTENVFGRRQGTCVHCGNCDLGCPARNTLDLNYFARAEDRGAEIRPLSLVYRIEPDADGYAVDFRRLDTGASGRETAKRAVVAAGSLGSTELLLRCRDEHRSLPALSPTLGRGWCANGDFLTPALYFDRDVAPTRGPTITTAIDYLDGSDGGHRYFVEDGGFPDVIGNALLATLARGPVGRQVFDGWRAALAAATRGRDPMSVVMPWFGQAVDSATASCGSPGAFSGAASG
jgi:cholesterol oxidase